MGNNLLDALKNAGLADAKKAKKAEQARKQQQHKDLKSGAPKAAAVAEAAPAAAVETDRAQAVQNVEAQVRERLAAAYRGAEVANASGRKKFYFQTLDHYIDCMMLSDVASALLERGKYAIVANENLDDYIIVRRAAALSIEAIDKKRIIVLRRQEC